MSAHWGIAVNNNLKPFSDVRVRKSLTLGIDRYTASRVLYPLNGLKHVGGLMRPGSDWAISEGELQKLPGFGRDAEKNLAEARRLLAEAALSSLSLGAAEPTPSWGLMLSGSAPMYAEKAPWIAVFPGLAISLRVFGFNLFGDSLRDALDQKLRRG